MTVTEFFDYLLEFDTSRPLGAELGNIYAMRTHDQALAEGAVLVGAGR
jgi:hypothetical protein